MEIVIGVLEQGLIYGILALALYLTYSVLNLPDLTVDGSFPLGAAVCCQLLLLGVHPALSLIASFLCGMAAGFITGLIHVKLGVRDLIAGIIVMTGLYTINLMIAGKANVPLFKTATMFNGPLSDGLSGVLGGWTTVVILLIPVLACKLALDGFLATKRGFLMKAAGDNPTLVITMARDPGNEKILGLALSNGLVAFAGAILAQQQRFFEIQMGTGTMVMGLASVIIGLKLFERIPAVRPTTAVIGGSVVYKAVVAAAIALGLSATSLRLITAILFLVILVLSRDGKKRRGTHA